MKKNLLKFILVLSFIAFLPIGVFAAEFQGPCPDGSVVRADGTCPVSSIPSLIFKIQDILGSILPLLISVGVIYFVWGVIRYMIADGEEAKKKSKDVIIYGLIGLAVIVGFWGLVTMIVTTFGLKAAAPSLAPLTVEESTCTLEGEPKLQDVLCYATRIINDSLIPLVFAVATVFFVWGAVKFFIINADEEAKREQGKQFMIWSIIALAVMLSVWGLVGILGSTFGIDGSALPQVQP